MIKCQQVTSGLAQGGVYARANTCEPRPAPNRQPLAVIVENPTSNENH